MLSVMLTLFATDPRSVVTLATNLFPVMRWASLRPEIRILELLLQDHIVCHLCFKFQPCLTYPAPRLYAPRTTLAVWSSYLRACHNVESITSAFVYLPSLCCFELSSTQPYLYRGLANVPLNTSLSNLTVLGCPSIPPLTGILVP